MSALLAGAVGCQDAKDGGSAPRKAKSKTKAEKPAPKKAPEKDPAPSMVAKPAPGEAPAPPGPPVRAASREEIEKVIASLTAQVKAGATAADNPWAMSHGLLAFGKEMKASDGRLAIDVIVSDFARLETVKGKKVYGFDKNTKSDIAPNPEEPDKKLEIPVEPHPDLLVKSLIEAGVPLDRKFKLKNGKTITLKRLVDDAAWAFSMPNTDDAWHKFAWSATLFLEAYGIDGVVKSHRGDVSVRSLVSRAVQRLEREQAFLLVPMSRGRPDQVQKRKQGIYGHTCGGLHFIQASVQGAGRSADKGEIFRARKQMDMLAFRWDAERRIYREMIRTQPKYRFLLLVQELKFHGHVLETMSMAHEWGVQPADQRTRKLAREVAADLIDAVRELKPMYDAQSKMMLRAPQSYYDLIGDGCHAIRGLRQALVAFYAPPTTP